MTKQQQNEIILAHVGEELRETDGVADRVGRALNQWFQQLLQMAGPPVEEPPPEGEQQPA